MRPRSLRFAIARRLVLPGLLLGTAGTVVALPARGGGLFTTSREPRSGKEWYARGMDRHESRRYDAAIEAFRKAIELGYREGPSSYNIACGYALQGDADRAFEWLGKAAAAGFELSSYLDGDDDLDGIREDPRFAELRKRAGDERHADDRTRALARLERLTAAAPKGGRDFYEAGRELLSAREFDKAAAAFQASAQRDYRPATSLYNAACAYARKGDKAAALDFLARGLEAGFDAPHHMDEDDDLDSIRHEPRFRELRRMAEELELPGALDGWWTRIVGEAFGPDWYDLEKRYRGYARRHPECGRAFFNLGFASLQLDEPKAAREAFRKALDLGYRKPVTMYDLACAHARLRERDAAFEWLFKALDAGFEPGGRLSFDRDLKSLRSDPRFRKARQIAEQRSGRDD